ncbi:hypothetical protein QAD02_020276 [Eretmocerus hayati]|uniref:Uncharacterized protein n=1 Tax=Eretmocerus hayati TaxID=131215 RepID=A0ACC2PPG0_9HYME|nr:hypothetical protein QAD02_020276 [Eretmocerus hayati]
MDAWEDLVLQWVNSLLGNLDNIVSVEELVDCKIFSQLITRIVSLNCKNFQNDRDMVSHFLENEYPNFKSCNESTKVGDLCFSSLVLCRLSLEPIFHRALCSNLEPDTQVKVKSILESVYPLGKYVTNQDLYEIFSHSDQTKTKLFPAKQKFILEEFLNSPATRSVQNDNKVHQMSRQVRNLRADLEMAHYEKSELIEDLKNHKKKVEDLELKLKQTEGKLKNAQRENISIDDSSSCETNNENLPQSLYRSELESLEKYVVDLQNENCKLQDDKQNLINEISTLTKNHQSLLQKSSNCEQTIETMLSQIVKKDDELSELKSKYEELSSYLKDKSSIHSSNYSFELDDRVISELSLNRSETLSSVIEVQLQDTRREMNDLQSRFRIIDKVLTVYIEEFQKKCIENFKGKMKLAQNNEINTISVQTDNLNESVLGGKSGNTCGYFNDSSSKERKESSCHPLIPNILCQVNVPEDTLPPNDVTIPEQLLLSMSNSSIVQSMEMSGKVSNPNKVTLALKYLKSKTQCDPSKVSSYSVGSLIKEVVLNLGTPSHICPGYESHRDILPLLINQELLKLDSDYLFPLTAMADKNQPDNSLTTISASRCITIDYNFFELILRFCMEFSRNIQMDKIDETPYWEHFDVQSIQSDWESLNQSITNCLKIYKVLLLLDQSWSLLLERFVSLITAHFKSSETLKKLFNDKEVIEKKIRNAYQESLQNLSLNLMSAIQFVTIITKRGDHGIAIVEVDSRSDASHKLPLSLSSHEIPEDSIKRNLESIDNLSGLVVDIKGKIDKFHNLLEVYEGQERSKSEFENNLHARDTNCASEESHHMTESKCLEVNHTEQVQNYLKEVHEKYETKLEKMKEKMKLVYNNQMAMLKKEQELIAKDKLNALQSKLESQCHNHVEELKKYKRHISELTTQLWDVGEKLIIEKQKREDSMNKLREFQIKFDRAESQNTKLVDHNQENRDPAAKHRKSVFQTNEHASFSKIQHVRGFQMMENAFRTEDEEGEVFDTTYLADMQRPRTSLSSVDINRLSILQMRNSKCKPHLKSSYPAEMQFHPVPLTEDEIKNGVNGSNPEEFLNDSLSQSLLTGKKVKRKDRARNASETPSRTRRFSNIFRKPRSSTEQK